MVTATQEAPKQELITAPFAMPVIAFEASMEQIAEMKAKFLPLVITDVHNEAQVAAVVEARKQVVRTRTSIEKAGKAMRDGANKFNKDVLEAQRTYTDPLMEVETHLKAEEQKVKDEEDRIAREAEEARQAKTRERLKLLQECGKSYMESDIAGLSDEDFTALLAAERKAKAARDEVAAKEKAEQDRIAEQQRLEREKIEKEKAELEERQAAANRRLMVMQTRIERMATLGHQHPHSNDQLADMSNEQWQELVDEAEAKKAEREKAAKAEQERLDKQREEQEAERKKLEAERKRIADEKAAARTRLIQNRVAALAALELYFEDVEFLGDLTAEQWEEEYAKAKADAKQRDDEAAAKEAAEQKAKADADAAELARIEALKPDHEKLLAVADAIKAIAVPQVSDDAKPYADDIALELRHCERELRAVCHDMAEGRPSL